MASNKRLKRLLQLLQLLQSGRKFNSSQLADHCQVSRRTIFRDLRTLQEAELPIQFTQNEQGYTVQNKVVVPSADFTFEEALSLMLLCNELGNPDYGIPFQHAARSASLKVLDSLSNRMQQKVQRACEAIRLQLGPTNPLKNSKPVYDMIVRGIIENRRVRIKYRSFIEDEPDEISTLLSPYRLVFSKKTWYVIGRSSIHRAVRTFMLGRIQHAELVDSAFKVPQRFTLEKHLGNAWSLIRERGNRHNVLVRFKPKVAGNVAEIHWHKSQKLTWRRDGQLDFQVTVDGLNEISWWILGYGDQAEVIKPKALRTLIQERIERMQNIYRKTKAKPKKTQRKKNQPKKTATRKRKS
ncbi:MAG: WYL domain-containing protein [Planctomycetaceae bacterium]